jgi:hypothetical protein
MSEDESTPTTSSGIPDASPEQPVLVETSSPKKSPKFISASDLPEIIKILVGADKISPDEAVRRLNNMVAKGTLVISPLLGTKRKV